MNGILWWYILVHFGPSPFAARWYFNFLRERSGQKRSWSRTCKEHGEERYRCCFGKKENWQPWPDYVCAQIAIVVSALCWPLVLLIAGVMLKPRKTTLEHEREKDELAQQLAALERELEAEANKALEPEPRKIDIANMTTEDMEWIMAAVRRGDLSHQWRVIVQKNRKGNG